MKNVSSLKKGLATVALLSAGLLSSQSAKAEKIEFYDADKAKWLVDTQTGTATLLNMIHLISRGDVVLPDAITYSGREYKVTAIGPLACINNGSLKTLKVGKYVEYIDSAAYTGSSALTKVELPEGLKNIKIRAFAGCSKLTDINIPSTVTAIGGYSFQGTALTSFTFSAKVTFIGDNPFRSSSTMKNITVAEGNPNYCSRDGVLFTKDMKRLISFPAGNGVSSYAIPEGVVKVGDNSMRNNTALKSVTMPNSLEEIGEMAFGLSGLTEVNLSKNVKTIGPAAFYMMSNLQGFNVDPQNPYYKGENGLLLSKDGKVLIGSILRTGTYTIPEGIEEIGGYAFYGSSSLLEVYLTNVKKVGDNAFYNCSSLEMVNFGKSLESIGYMCFQNCRKLASIYLPATTRRLAKQAFTYCSGLTQVTLNEGLAFIGQMSFYGCSALKEISIPGSVVLDPEGAHFYNCGALTKAELGEGITDLPSLCFSYCPTLRTVKVPTTLKSVGDYCFQQDVQLRKFEFPAGLTKIDKGAFNLSGISGSIVLPEGIDTLGSWAFTSCKNITSAVTNKKLKVLMDHAFHGCSKIQSISLNEGLTFIGTNALSIIDSLRSLTIPSSVTQVDSLAINYNTNMENLSVLSPVPPTVNGLLAHYIDMKKDGVDWNPFEYTTLHVPEGSVEAYRNHPEWGRFVKIVGDAGVTGIENDADAVITDVYDLQGHRLAKPQPGKINIIRYSNGKVGKVLVPATAEY